MRTANLVVVVSSVEILGAFAATGCPDNTPGCTEDEPASPPAEVQCCPGDTLECAACRQGVPVTKFCADNMKYPGCAEKCCDEGCSTLCERVDVGKIRNEFTCPWRVLNQTHKLWAPVILEADVEKGCNVEEYGYQHLLQCKQCAEHHDPCRDQYMACGGCCGQTWHKHLGIDINTHHTCPEIKSFFKTRNSGVMKCEDAPQTPASYDVSAQSGTTHHGAVTVEVGEEKTEATEKVLKSGFVTTQCTTNVTQLHCTRIPFKLKFECDKCNLGVPKLLKDCCDECVNWIKGLDSDPTLPDYIKGFGFCQGCDATHIYPVDLQTGDKLDWKMEWSSAGDYDDYTEEIADQQMEQFIEEHVCGLLTPECGATTTQTTSSPTFLNPTYSEESNLNICLPYGNGCSGGRRLSEVEGELPYSESGKLLPSVDANATCAQVDPDHYAKSKSSGDDMTQKTSTDVPSPSEDGSQHGRGDEVDATDAGLRTTASLSVAMLLPLLCLYASGLRD